MPCCGCIVFVKIRSPFLANVHATLTEVFFFLLFPFTTFRQPVHVLIILFLISQSETFENYSIQIQIKFKQSICFVFYADQPMTLEIITTWFVKTHQRTCFESSHLGN